MMQSPPLKGLKVLELASVLAGPSVGMFFAELGATVFKIENMTTRGDVTRNWKLAAEDPATDISGYFSSVNWGKQSLALDLCQKEGLQIIYDLTAVCDIILVSYKPGDAQKLGVDYSTLKSYNKKIIYSHITGYGLNNKRAGFDAIIQAETGFTFMNGEAQGPPVKMPVALMDILAAHQLKEAILLALYHRERSGQGQFIETSLFRAGVSSLANQATNWLVGKAIPKRLGSDHPNIVPYGTIFTTADKKEIVLAIGTEKQFQQLVAVLGHPELAHDERFCSNQNRVVYKEEINSILQSLIHNYQRDDLLLLLEQKSVPAGGVYNMKEVFEVPEAQPMILDGKYDDGTQIKGVRSIAFDTSEQMKGERLSPPPHYGQHTREILSELLNYDQNTITQLIHKGVVYAK